MKLKSVTNVNESLITAYVLLLSNKIDEAESVLINAKQFYRAIKLNINLFRWDRALNIALNNKTDIDTVLAYRKKYLETANLDETNSRFIELNKEVK
jgi:intraflagellar transport protein 80